MNNDLISRNAVIKYLRKQQENVIIEKNKNGFVNSDVCDGMSSAIEAFMNFIMQSPTAYDVDKAVERLRTLSDIADDKIMEQEGPEQYWDGFGYGIDEAIKILNAGGIE